MAWDETRVTVKRYAGSHYDKQLFKLQIFAESLPKFRPRSGFTWAIAIATPWKSLVLSFSTWYLFPEGSPCR